MIKKRYLVALGAVSVALGACASEINGTGPGGNGTGATGPEAGGSNTGGGSATGGTAGSGTGGSSATGGAPTGGTGGTPTGGTGGTLTGGTGGGGIGGTGGSAGDTTCVPGLPATSQVQRMKNLQYDNVVKELLGVTTLAAAGNNAPSFLLVDDSPGSLTDIAWNAYQVAGQAIATEVMGGANRSKFIACDPAMAGCLADTIRSFGRKAFRRPLTDTEIASFTRLDNLTPKGTPEQTAEAILYTFLVSPSFIMLPELAQDVEGAGIRLSPYEVAARLSFLIWNSSPDDILAAAADANELLTKEQILAQATRMVQVREKAGPVVAAYHRTYADIRQGSHWADIEHDTAKYPLWSANVKTQMMAEINAFFEEVAFQGGQFKDLFLSNVAYVNQDTAPIYGLDPAGYGPALTRVELDLNQRPGFLTRVGFLASYSAGASTSPILRGAFVTTKILAVELGDPPPEAADTPIPPGNYTTQRQVTEAHTAPPNCAGCHAGYINPAGFVMENYDSVGKWQTVDPLTGPIVTTADVVFSDTNIKTIATPLELMTELGTGPDAKHHYAEKWVEFATGRVGDPADACVADELSLRLASDGYTILNVLADLTQADSFRLRTVGN